MKILKKISVLGVILLTTAAALHAVAVSKPPSKPNILLTLIDDFGCECVGFNGGESYNTPVRDQLAAPSVRFTQCHA